MTKGKRSELQILVDSYLTSGLSGNEYINSCVESGEMNTTEAINTLSMLQNDHTFAFELSEINKKNPADLEMVLSHKISEKKTTSPPIFHIKFDSSLSPRKKEVIKLLHDFSKDLAILMTKNTNTTLTDYISQEKITTPSYEPLKKHRKN